jgi:hypothetical protein
VLSSATQLVEIIPGSSRTRFRDRPETVRLHRGIGVHLHPGTLFGIIPECRSESSRNRVHVRPESPQNGGKLEIAQQMAGHESARTTGLYDRRNDSVALDEIEKIAY